VAVLTSPSVPLDGSGAAGKVVLGRRRGRGASMRVRDGVGEDGVGDIRYNY
jgi:hypothetical protein